MRVISSIMQPACANDDDDFKRFFVSAETLELSKCHVVDMPCDNITLTIHVFHSLLLIHKVESSASFEFPPKKKLDSVVLSTQKPHNRMTA